MKVVVVVVEGGGEDVGVGGRKIRSPPTLLLPPPATGPGVVVVVVVATEGSPSPPLKGSSELCLRWLLSPPTHSISHALPFFFLKLVHSVYFHKPDFPSTLPFTLVSFN